MATFALQNFLRFRSSHPDVFLRKGVLKICSKFAGEHPCRSVISIKLQSNFIEITLWHGCSPVNLLHILRTPFPKNTSGRLLLVIKTKEYSYYLKGSFDEIQTNGLYSYKAMMWKFDAVGQQNLSGESNHMKTKFKCHYYWN